MLDINLSLSPYHADVAEFARHLMLRVKTIDSDQGKRVIEVAVLDVSEYFKTKKMDFDAIAWESRFNPECSISVKTAFATGLTAMDLAKHKTFKELGEQLRQYIGDATLIGHGIDADMEILNAEMARAGLKLFRNKTICTLALVKKVLPYWLRRSCKLGDGLYDFFKDYAAKFPLLPRNLLINDAINNFKLFCTFDYVDKGGTINV